MSTTPDGTPRGKFIAIEGGDGAGKTTQIAWLAAALAMHGVGEDQVLFTRQPGGTLIGQHLRELLLAKHLRESIDPRAELLLFAADRAQHVATVIRPALKAARHVITDRYTASTIAYQCGGHGVPVQHGITINDIATDHLRPDLTILLDLDPTAGLARRGQRATATDRLEAEPADFHQRVRDMFRTVVEREKNIRRAHCAVIDAGQPIGDVHAQVWHHVAPLLGLPADQPARVVYDVEEGLPCA